MTKISWITQSKLVSLMAENKAFTYRSVAELYDVTASRVEQALKPRDDIDFKKAKNDAIWLSTRTDFDKLDWYRITNPVTKNPYFVTKCGKASKLRKSVVKGVTVTNHVPIGSKTIVNGYATHMVTVYLKDGRQHKTTVNSLINKNCYGSVSHE